MSVKFDGSNARFWRNVNKLVSPEEKLVLLDNGRFVPPDQTLSRVTYQLARIKDMNLSFLDGPVVYKKGPLFEMNDLIGNPMGDSIKTGEFR
jgi:hypothetical protein